MTIAMFSLVVFSITVMGIINASFLDMMSGEEGTGQWDVLIQTNRNNPIDDLAAELRSEGSVDPAVIAATGRVTWFDDESQEVRVPGKDWETFPIIAADEDFYRAARMKLEARARGYDDAEAVYEAVRSTPDLAIVDSSVVQQAGFGGGFMLHVDVTIKDDQFDAFELEIHDVVTGRSRLVTVVGIFSSRIPGNIFYGLYTNEPTYRQLFGAPEYRTWYIRLVPGTDSERAAKNIKAALVTRGVEAESIEKMIADVLAQSRGFLRIFQVFMALGLFVGIASLAVIALRSVVERRQQIGMLRAIGYQRGTVALSFILESGFIALMGIASGVIGATILSYNLLASGQFAGAGDITFYVPWGEVATYALLAFGCALLMTWWPSRRASSVPIADALRYE